jgi:Ca2+/Na+ antiporter
MIINSFRGLAIILLVSILIIKEVPLKKLLKDPMIQFYLAVVCMLILLLVDNILGFILSICVLSLYFRIYTSELKNKEKNEADVSGTPSQHSHSHNGKACSSSDSKCEMNMARLEEKTKIAVTASAVVAVSADGSVPYITEENLLDAQTNIVNPVEYNRELHTENIYGSQGLDTKNLHIRGYDTTNQYLGSLSFDIIGN